MSDNLKDRGAADRRLVSSQPHEVGYVIKKLTAANPNVPRDQVVKAIFKARDEIGPSESRKKFMDAAQKNIK